MTSDSSIEHHLRENRSFSPSEDFKKNAHIASQEHYEKLWNLSIKDPDAFWGEQAKNVLTWHKSWTTVRTTQGFDTKWFDGGELNVSVNCLDRHLHTQGDKKAILWEGENGDKITFTYRELYESVCRAANGLKKMGLKKGDVVSIYLPMIPELAISMLACARLGVQHNVIFAGFSSKSIAERNNDAKATLMITADGCYRRGQELHLKPVVDEALLHSPTVTKVLVVKRIHSKIEMQSKRDYDWNEVVNSCDPLCPPENVPSEHPLFLLYTSGSTGKPKGILHTTAGYLLGASLSFKYVFDFKPDDIFWCTADIGWITGHSYVVYGPLSNASTVLMYEGAPNTPDWGRFWKMIQDYRVTKFYTAPTAIRSFMQQGEEWPAAYDLSSIKLLGSVGEPINPEAWMWYHEVIGKKSCPIVDTWWQTETGSIMISPMPGAFPTKPGSATKPFFGIEPAIVDDKGHEVSEGQGGFLVLKKPWPSMLRTIHNDHERYKKQYLEPIKGVYFTGDGARKDHDGYFWIMGRIDDVINVSGHRLSTMEIESALVCHQKVVEAAVVSKPHPIKGEAIVCFVTLDKRYVQSEALMDELKEHVVKEIGAIARPEAIVFTETLPKTRSGKIMRRLLRDIAMGKNTIGDVTTLDDLSALKKLSMESPL